MKTICFSSSLVLSLLFFLSTSVTSAQNFESPAALREFKEPASSEEVLEFTKKVANYYDFLSYQIIGNSVEGKDIIAVKASKPGAENNKLRILLFGQQHGNEQSSKESLLLIIRDINKYQEWLDVADIWIVPQVNPDGADINQRRNAMDLDLNRDHVVLDAPESLAIQRLFQNTLPHVTVDIHEYFPYRESWEEFGGFKNFDVQVGVPTNINVEEQIRSFALNNVLPEIENHLAAKGFSFHNYLVGPVPTEGRTRYSTVDINDGRQSFAIRNTMSFIYEGINGKDGFVEGLERRTIGQYEAIVALLNFLTQNHYDVVELVNESREKLINSQKGNKVTIRMDHFKNSSPLKLPLTSSRTGEDTTVVVKNFHPLVKPIAEVKMPKAYLVPANDSLLLKILQKHNVFYEEAFDLSKNDAYKYFINSIEETEIENFDNIYPQVEKRKVKVQSEDYIIVPIAQLHANFLVLIFEPQSMLGLAQREGFEYLLEEGKAYPVLRLE